MADLGKIEEADFEAPAIQDEEETWAPTPRPATMSSPTSTRGVRRSPGLHLPGGFSPRAATAVAPGADWRVDPGEPNSGKLPKGWLHIDVVDQHGDVVETTEIYVRLKLKSALKRKPQEPEAVIEYTLLHSSLRRWASSRRTESGVL
jgi:hypothetical protein